MPQAANLPAPSAPRWQQVEGAQKLIMICDVAPSAVLSLHDEALPNILFILLLCFPAHKFQT
jgi:hypothetical protein